MVPEEASVPPLGLLTVAALCPPTWTLRLLDHTFERITDADYQNADLVMVSAMHAQRTDTLAILRRARALGTRTFIGGPWASSEPERLQQEADHVMVGEAEDVFADIAIALQNGTVERLYRITDKPDLSRSPLPRFDLLRRDKYISMSVQFSRGCPYQCDFCDIITIYGRKPRTKSPAQLIAELDSLYAFGWRSDVFIVDDNFVGNQKVALRLAKEIALLGEKHDRPFPFQIQASVDLANHKELMQAMAEANFLYVFLGIESPSAEALRESKKLNNLRKNTLEQVRIIQQNGFWVQAGFIVGFDSDDQTIFARQRTFIEQAAIPWAMVGMLQAPPTTPLFDRMTAEGRIIEDSQATSNFSAPNFRTNMPLPILLEGLSGLLADLYKPEVFFQRALRSLEVWQTTEHQKPDDTTLSSNLRKMAASVWTQGIRSDYRSAYWRFLWVFVLRYWKNPLKISLGFVLLLSAHHFLVYARQVAEDLTRSTWSEA